MFMTPPATVQAALPGFDDIPPVVRIDHSFVPEHVRGPLATARLLGGKGSRVERIMVFAWDAWRTGGAAPSDSALGSLAGCPTWVAGEAADALAAEGLWPTFRSVDDEPSEAMVMAAIAAVRREKVKALVGSSAKVRRRIGRLQMCERRGAIVMSRRGEGVETGS